MRIASGLRLGAAPLLPIALTLLACSPGDDAANSRKAAQLLAEQTAATDKKRCEDSMERRLGEFHELVAQGKFWDARTALGDCPRVLQREDLRQLMESAERKDYEKSYSIAGGNWRERLAALQRMRRDYPDMLSGRRPSELASLEKRASIEDERLERAAQAKVRAEKRRQGVSIGMTQQDVLESSWGRPHHVNRTVTARGTREQWVYGGGYLYFEDGVLTAIQN